MRDELDSLIDGALAEYSKVEPLAGLEERVLARVRRPRRSRRWWWLAVPVAAVVVLLLRPAPEVAPPVVALVAPPAPPVVAPSPARHRVVRRARPAELPKRNVFPTITPLTAEERLLIHVASTHPEELASPATPAGEIEIKPIEIAPLDMNGGQ
jgi:hypothetical protein